MKRSIPSFLALQAFEAAAEHLSFTKAGEELHVTQAAISRQIRLLEEYLQTPLFIRGTRSIELTSFGRTYLSTISTALDMIEQAGNAQKRKQPTLSVSILPSLGALWLLQKLMEFTYAHPHIQLDISSSLDPINWQGREHHVDVAIRLGKLPNTTHMDNVPQLDFQMTDHWSGIAAIHLWDDYVTPYCSLKFMEEHGPFDSPKDLQRVTLLHNNFRSDIWPAWLQANNAPEAMNASRLDFSHSFLVANAMRAGFGMACLSKIEIEPVEWRDEVVQPFENTLKSAGNYYFLAPREKLQNDNVQLFLQWLKKLYP